MCLAIPAKVIAVNSPETARIEVSGVQKEISISLVDDVKTGDYLIVHVGHAIGRVDPEEAEKTLACLQEMAEEDARLLAHASV